METELAVRVVSEETRKKMSLARKGRSYESIFGSAEKAAERRLKSSLAMKKRWQDLEFRERASRGIAKGIAAAYKRGAFAHIDRSAQARNMWANDEIRARICAIFKAQRSTADYRRTQSEVVKAAMARPAVRRRLRKIYRSKDYKLKHSAGLKEAYRSGRRKVSKVISKKTSKLETSIATAVRKSIATSFRTSYEIPKTKYIVDIYFESKRLIVEVDGHPSHYNDSKRVRHDRKRDRVLKSLDYRILHLRRKSIKRGIKFCVNRIRRELNAANGKRSK